MMQCVIRSFVATAVLSPGGCSTSTVREGFVVHRKWTFRSTIGTPLTAFLFNEDPGTFPSITSAKKAVRRGLVYIDGKCAGITDIVGPADEVQVEVLQRVAQGSYITQHFYTRDTAELSRRGFLVPVLWEDDHLAVVLKPQGLPVFKSTDGSAGGGEQRSTNGESSNSGELKCSCLQSALPYSLLPVTPSTGDADDLNLLRRPQPVHRLDKETGGLLLVAKTKPALISLSKQFTTRVVKKRYLALTVSAACTPADRSGIMDIPLGGQHARTTYAFAASEERHQQQQQQQHVGGADEDEDEGEEKVQGAVCRRTPVASCGDGDSDDGDDVWGDDVFRSSQSQQPLLPGLPTPYGFLRTVHLSLHTGRTHQIRKHLDMAGSPVLGDPTYYFSDGGRASIGSTLRADSGPGASPGPVPGPAVPRRRLRGEGMALYSVGLSFIHPVHGDRITVQIPEPASFGRLRSIVFGGVAQWGTKSDSGNE